MHEYLRHRPIFRTIHTVVFIDRMEIELSAGKGGDGSTSYARHAKEPLAGPDGGDGGKGGDVYLSAKAELEDLNHLANSPAISAEDGKNGMGGKCFGKNGTDETIDVPCGTRVICARSGVELARMMEPGVTTKLLAGGKGGRGNVKFATASRRTPQRAEAGAPGEERLVEIVYRQAAPVVVMDSTSSVGEDYYFRFYAHLSRNRVADFYFYMRKPRIFYWSQDFRKYQIAFLPYQLRQKQSDNVKFPNLSHVYHAHILVFHAADMKAADAGAVLKRMLDELEELDHPNLEHFIAIAGGDGFGEPPGELMGEWRRMCDNHPALSGAETEIILVPPGEGEERFGEIDARLAKLALKFAKGE